MLLKEVFNKTAFVKLMALKVDGKEKRGGPGRT
jgi:hypothetical protein